MVNTAASLLHRAAKADSARDFQLLPQALLLDAYGFAPFVQHGQTVQAPAVALLNQQLTHPAELDTLWWSVHEGAQMTTRWVMLAGEPASWFLLVVSVASLQGSLNLELPIGLRLPTDRGLLEAIATNGAVGFAVEKLEFGHAQHARILWVEPDTRALQAQLRLPRMAGVRTRDRAWSRAAART